MLRLTFCLLSILLVACAKDEPGTPDLATLCDVIGDYSDCTELSALSPDDYRTAIAGTWVLRAKKCGYCVHTEAGCQEIPAEEEIRVAIDPDGTLVYTSPSTGTITTTYSIVTRPPSETPVSTVLEIADSNVPFTGIRYQCGTLGVNDYSDFIADLGKEVFEKVE